MELIEVLQGMILFIAVTFVVVEFIKKAIKQAVAGLPGWVFFVLSIALGIAFSYGWSLRVLPAPTAPAFHHVNAVVTGIIIGAAASGIFSGLDEMFPDLGL